MTNPDNVGGLPTADQLYDIAADAWDQHQTNCRVTTIAGSLRKAVEAIHRELCRAAPAGGDVCKTCQGHGMIGWTTGQTPEQFDQHEAPCPDCSAPAGGDCRGTIPQALNETINGVVSDLEMIAAGKDQVTGDPVSGLQSQRIAKSAHDRLLSSWSACDSAPAGGDVSSAWEYGCDAPRNGGAPYIGATIGGHFVRFRIEDDFADAVKRHTFLRTLQSHLNAAPAGGDPERGKNDPSWSLFDRVDFALRDAGFDLDEASDIAALAAAQESALAGAHTAKDSAPAGSGEVEKLIDDLIDHAFNDGNEGVEFRSEQVNNARAALLRKLQQGAAIPPHDAEEYRNIVFNPDERTSAIIRQAQAAGWNKCRAWLIAASQGQEGGNG